MLYVTWSVVMLPTRQLSNLICYHSPTVTTQKLGSWIAGDSRPGPQTAGPTATPLWNHTTFNGIPFLGIRNQLTSTIISWSCRHQSHPWMHVKENRYYQCKLLFNIGNSHMPQLVLTWGSNFFLQQFYSWTLKYTEFKSLPAAVLLFTTLS